MATLEQIIEDARKLSPDERRRLRETLDRHDAERAAYNTREREQAWIRAHREEYMGQWVALDGDRLVAHGANAREVYLAARAAGVSVPFMEHVRNSDEPFCGGWL